MDCPKNLCVLNDSLKRTIRRFYRIYHAFVKWVVDMSVVSFQEKTKDSSKWFRNFEIFSPYLAGGFYRSAVFCFFFFMLIQNWTNNCFFFLFFKLNRRDFINSKWLASIFRINYARQPAQLNGTFDNFSVPFILILFFLIILLLLLFLLLLQLTMIISYSV